MVSVERAMQYIKGAPVENDTGDQEVRNSSNHFHLVLSLHITILLSCSCFIASTRMAIKRSNRIQICCTTIQVFIKIIPFWEKLTTIYKLWYFIWDVPRIFWVVKVWKLIIAVLCIHYWLLLVGKQLVLTILLDFWLIPTTAKHSGHVSLILQALLWICFEYCVLL